MRKGLGKGLGKGYKNIVPRDPFIHGLSAKGIPTQFKRDTTRLKNLMDDYRNHIIYRSAIKQKHKKETQVVEEIDNSIKTLKFGLNAKAKKTKSELMEEYAKKKGIPFIKVKIPKRKKKMSELEKTFLSKEFEILTEQDIYAKGYRRSPADYKKLKVGTKVRFHTRRGVITSQPKYVSGSNWGGYVAKIKWSDGEESEWNLHRFGLEFYGKLPPLPKITGKTKTVYGVIIPEGHKRVLGGDTIFTSKREAEQFVKRKKKDFLSADDYKYHKIKKFKVSKSEFVPVLGDWVYERGQVHFARSQWQGD